jgi:E3 ubiquitin-protein ligase DOA10
MQCRICYEGAEDGPLLNPCNCKGEAGAMHQRCLATWIRVSNNLRCEVCKGAYTIPELVLEPTYKPPAIVLLLATHPSFIFIESILMYIIYVCKQNPYSPFVYTSIFSFIPYSLLLVTAGQACVMGPAIARIRDKERYLLYMCSLHYYPGTRFTVASYYMLATVWLFLSWCLPVLSSIFFLFTISNFYDYHCMIVKNINRAVTQQFIRGTVSLNRSQQ